MANRSVFTSNTNAAVLTVFTFDGQAVLAVFAVHYDGVDVFQVTVHLHGDRGVAVGILINGSSQVPFRIIVIFLCSSANNLNRAAQFIAYRVFTSIFRRRIGTELQVRIT